VLIRPVTGHVTFHDYISTADYLAAVRIIFQTFLIHLFNKVADLEYQHLEFLAKFL
jgi:hypothetical protein